MYHFQGLVFLTGKQSGWKRARYVCCSRRDAISVATERCTPKTLRVFTYCVREQNHHKIITRHWDMPWPARSPGLICLRFLSLGYLKSRIFATRIPDLRTLKARIPEEVGTIPHWMLASVVDNFVRRLRECISQNGGYLPGVIFEK
jgi:hypothetical protein